MVSEPVRIKKHPMLLVEFYHALEERSKGTPGRLRAEVLLAIDALFRIPIVEAKEMSAGAFGATQLNTWWVLETGGTLATPFSHACLKSACCVRNLCAGRPSESRLRWRRRGLSCFALQLVQQPACLLRPSPSQAGAIKMNSTNRPC